MMMRVNLMGQRFGRYVVLEYIPSNKPHGHSRWKCICDCGNIRNVYGWNLKKGTSSSCGCYAKELSRIRGESCTVGGWNKGLKTPDYVKEKISKSLTGIATRGSGWHHSDQYRRNKAQMHKGELSHFWKGGKTTESKTLRNSVDFSIWRENVFKRDNWTCQDCFKRGVELNAHHINAFSKFPLLRFDVSNGITLCHECHKKYHSHKFGKNLTRALAKMRQS